MAINIPGTILPSLQAAGHTVNDLKLQFLVYRNAKLFPNVISSKTEEIMRDRHVSSSVLAIQMGKKNKFSFCIYIFNSRMLQRVFVFGYLSVGQLNNGK